MKLILCLAILLLAVASFVAGGDFTPPKVIVIERPAPMPPEIIYRRPEATELELGLAFAKLDRGESSHQFYIDNPEKQTAVTGDTTWNKAVIWEYRLLRELLKRAYK